MLRIEPIDTIERVFVSLTCLLFISKNKNENKLGDKEGIFYITPTRSGHSRKAERPNSLRLLLEILSIAFFLEASWHRFVDRSAWH